MKDILKIRIQPKFIYLFLQCGRKEDKKGKTPFCIWFAFQILLYINIPFYIICFKFKCLFNPKKIK